MEVGLLGKRQGGKGSDFRNFCPIGTLVGEPRQVAARCFQGCHLRLVGDLPIEVQDRLERGEPSRYDDSRSPWPKRLQSAQAF
jgi:hypothetical protein